MVEFVRDGAKVKVATVSMVDQHGRSKPCPRVPIDPDLAWKTEQQRYSSLSAMIRHLTTVR